MSGTPFDLLMRDYIPRAEQEIVQVLVAEVKEPTSVKCLRDLKTPTYGSDPNELLKHRFLYRGGIGLVLGPTGVGKSSLLMQLAIYWSVGLELFGLEPGDTFQTTGMRILIVQAENDEGDLAEMRDGVLKGCRHLNDEDKALAGERIKIATICDKSGAAFTAELDVLLSEQGPFDLVIVDPAFAYLGGDSNSQKDVSRFMRELINPLVKKHNVGLIIAHHTNKPKSGKEKDNWEASDYSYLGAGSAEWVNPSRFALALRSIGSDTVFELRAPKRGKRLRWKDEHGKPTMVRYIAHHEEPGVICWQEAELKAVEELKAETDKGKSGRRKQYDEVECVHAVLSSPRESQAFYVNLLIGNLNCSKQTARMLLQNCVKNGWVSEHGDAHFRRYDVTESGRNEAQITPTVHAWL